MIENLVGLYVKDPERYQLYREALMPLLSAVGGGFRCDFMVNRVLKSQTGDPINRLFVIYFPNDEVRKNFFEDARYKEIRARYFEPAVLSTTLISAYEVPDPGSRPTGETPRKSEGLYSRLIDKIPDVIYRMALPGGQYEFINSAATAVFGYAPEDFYANPKLIQKIIHPDWIPYFLEQWDRLLQGDVPSSYEYQVIHKNGESRWVNQRNVLIKGDDGRPAAIEGVITDVTDPKRVELALRENEEKYRRLIETTGTGYVILDDSGRVTDANREYAQLTGRVELEEVIGHSVLEWTAPHDLERNAAEVQKCLERGFARNLEIDYLTPSGRIIPVEINATVLRSSGGLRILTLCRDITERKRAEEALRESEARYRSLFEANPHPMWVYDLETLAFLAVNDAALTHYGFSREEFLAMTIVDIRPPEDVPRLLDNLARVGEKRFDQTDVWRHRTKDGAVIEVEITSHYLDYQGRKARVVVAYDVTERKRVERALRESEARYRALFEASPQPMWVYDLETLAFLAVNDAAMVHYGFSREEFLAMTITDIRPSEDVPRLLEILAQPGEQRIDRSGAWRHRKKDGSIIQVEISSHMLDYRGQRAKLVLVNDITDRLRAAEEKEKLQAQLLQAQKMESVARLAGGVAHDFNNMLSAILGHAELAMMQCLPSEPIQADLRSIQNAAQRSAQLTRQLLAFARKQTVVPRVLDLNDTVAGLLKMLLRLIGEDIDLVWKPAAGLWPVKMDPSQIDQILVNLCINARDAITGVGRITIETENAAFAEEYCALDPDFACGEYVLLAVSDDGCGMGPEILERLFEPFFTTKEVGKGTGLGLATVYGIVRQNEGFINVHSEPGRGTTFKIFLPRFAGAVRESDLPGAAESPRGRGETVLLVEDEAAILDLGRAMLEGLGYRVLTAGTPGEALRQAEAQAAELKLLITDVVMPEMNGRELAKLLEALQPGLKCLFISGYTADVITHRGVLDDDICFLQKPFSMHDLALKVRRALAGEL